MNDDPSATTAPDELSAKSVIRLRHFSLATLLIIVAAYALFVGALSALRVPPIVTLDIAIFLTAIGLAQEFLFGGRKPRRASVISGGLTACVLAGGQTYWYVLDPNYPEGLAWAPYIALAAAITGAIHGMIFGYVVGRLIGLLFVWGDYLHRPFTNPATFKPKDRALAEIERRSADFESGKVKAAP